MNQVMPLPMYDEKAQVMPLPMYDEKAVRSSKPFQVDDHVMMKQFSDLDWNRGVVTSVHPLHVRYDKWFMGHPWEQVQHRHFFHVKDKVLVTSKFQTDSQKYPVCMHVNEELIIKKIDHWGWLSVNYVVDPEPMDMFIAPGNYHKLRIIQGTESNAFVGRWIRNNYNVNQYEIYNNGTLQWNNDRKLIQVAYRENNGIYLFRKGEHFMGRLSDCQNYIKWSSGNTWYRSEGEKVNEQNYANVISSFVDSLFTDKTDEEEDCMKHLRVNGSVNVLYEYRYCTATIHWIDYQKKEVGVFFEGSTPEDAVAISVKDIQSYTSSADKSAFNQQDNKSDFYQEEYDL